MHHLLAKLSLCPPRKAGKAVTTCAFPYVTPTPVRPPRRLSQRLARNRTDTAQHSLRQVWRLEIPGAAHIKDVLAFLRWAENPRDKVAGFRVIQLLPGAGPVTAARLLNSIAETTDTTFALEQFAPPATAIGHWRDFVETIQLVRGRAMGWPARVGQGLPLVRSASGADSRGRGYATGRSRAIDADRLDLPDM
jgi:hypothetical protein